ncbi:MAG: ribonuclease J [Clostridiales bacterium]|nr:ribonuclease J [Clostridiales bacterium]
MASKKLKLRVFSLGGLGEIGKNITVFEYGEDIIVVDCGVSFPEDDMLGIDLVIPDFTYLIRNKDRVRGVFFTHGHEDHIGSVPYFLREIDAPLFGTKLTLGLIDIKLREHGLDRKTKCVCVTPGEKVQCGRITAEFIRVTHSIPDACAIAVSTPNNLTCVVTGDFKVDFTPIHDQKMDLQRFAELGKRGVDLLLCESTNVEAKGYTMSERTVGGIFENIFNESRDQRLIIATFSSNIHRIQQIIDSAAGHGRKVAVIGRSMINTVKCAIDLNYIDAPKDIMIEPGEIKRYTDGQLVIITTGTQGEPMSALSRMAASEHRLVDIHPGDKIVISASSIPGNEKSIGRVINELMKRGAEVLYEGLMDVHVSGHGKQEEIKLMHALTSPKFLMPIHGEFRHLKRHRDLAIGLGMPKENIFLMSIGEVLELTPDGAKVTGTVPAGQVLVDGLGVGDVGNIVLRDRKHLSQDGLIIVVVSIDRSSGQIIAGPDIISRGFVYVRENEDMMDETRKAINEALSRRHERRYTEWSYIKTTIKDTVKGYVWHKTKRSPMILPIIMEV